MREAMSIMSGISDTRSTKVGQQSESALLGYFTKYIFLNITDEFELEYLDEEYRAPVVVDVPTLAFSGTLDGLTNLESAEEALAQFSNLTHVIVHNGGHTDIQHNTNIHYITVEFMRGNAVPSGITVPLPVLWK